MPRLKIVSATSTREVPLAGRCVVGRADECDLVLEDDKSSRRHCEFVQEGDTVTVRDLGSSNGTLVNDAKVEEQVLQDGDQVRIGATILHFLAADADHAIEFVEGQRAGERVPLVGERITLGRKPENTRTFDDIKVSGVHLEVAREGDQWVLRDLGSTNGTVLDGCKVDEVALTHGDRVRLGEQEFVFLDLQAAAPAAAEQAPAAKALSAVGARRGGLGGVLALVGLLAILGGAAWFFFFYERGGGGEGGKVLAPAPVPTGSLLAADWSFEDGDAVGGLWTTDSGSGFRVRRGGSRSGGSCFLADPEGTEVAAAARTALPVVGVPGLSWQVSLEAAEGALASLVLRFLPEDEDEPDLGALSVVVAQVLGGEEYQDLSGTVAVPQGAGAVQAVLVARGGDVRVDDLSLGRAAAAPTAQEGPVRLADRGRMVGVAQLQPQVELFDAYGTYEVEGKSQELPAGALQLEVSRAGAQVQARWSPGPFAPQALRILVRPETAATGITVMHPETSVRQAGSFQAEDAVALVLGGSAERTEIRFSQPCRLTSLPFGDGLQIRVEPPGTSLSATLRGDFEAERQEASSLFVQAQTAAREGRLGEALTKFRDVRNRLPYHDQTVAQVREQESALLLRINQEIAEIDAMADAAEFLDSLVRYRAVVERMDALQAALAGTDAVEALEERSTAIRARVAELGSEERDAEAARLERLAEAFERLEFIDRSLSADELRRALKESY